MAVPNPPLPVLRFVGLLAANEEMLAAARRELSQWYGAIDDISEIIPFTFTDYYQAQMGNQLLRQWARFSTLFAPEQLAKCKLETNMAEVLLARQFPQNVLRPVNMDPGYVSRYKVVLATTKDHSHRVYLTEGIYAEVTLHWSANCWTAWPWTYADYKTQTASRFFEKCRDFYFRQIQKTIGSPGLE
jgi:hypothetical protein